MALRSIAFSALSFSCWGLAPSSFYVHSECSASVSTSTASPALGLSAFLFPAPTIRSYLIGMVLEKGFSVHLCPLVSLMCGYVTDDPCSGVGPTGVASLHLAVALTHCHCCC